MIVKTILIVALLFAFSYAIDPIDFVRLRRSNFNEDNQSYGLPNGVSELNGINASITNNNDLAPFVRLANRASIFAIGESAHGVAGYQSFQFRLSKYLIMNYNYRRILTEILSDDRALNHYLLTGEGNINQILYLNTWQGDDKEMAEFWQWIREYNSQNQDKPVTAHTVDPQNPWLDAPIIRSFLQEYNTSLENQYMPIILANCFGAKYNNQIEWAFSPETAAYSQTGTLPQNETNACFAVLQEIKTLLETKKNVIIKRVGYTTYQDAINAVRSLRAWIEKSILLYFDPQEAMIVREEAFGPSVLWKWRRNNPKEHPAILIAHHLHISKEVIENNYFGEDYWVGLHSVGVQLKDELDEKYVAVAQSGYNVTAMFQRGPFPYANSTLSIDFKLNDYQKPWLLVKTDANWIKNQGQWLVQEESVINGRYYDLSKAFDRLVFHLYASAGKFLGNI